MKDFDDSYEPFDDMNDDRRMEEWRQEIEAEKKREEEKRNEIFELMEEDPEELSCEEREKIFRLRVDLNSIYGKFELQLLEDWYKRYNGLAPIVTLYPGTPDYVSLAEERMMRHLQKMLEEKWALEDAKLKETP